MSALSFRLTKVEETPRGVVVSFGIGFLSKHRSFPRKRESSPSSAHLQWFRGVGSRFRGNACIGGRPRLANGSSTHFRHAAFLGLLLNFIFLPHFLFAKKQTKENVHITIIRELGSEIAVAKVPLPRGKRGIFLNAKGEVNQADADSEMKLNGPAIRAGMPVEITKITFKSGKIVFEINGGGKSREKWYQHIEIGVGGSTQPISQQPPVLTYGSWITLNLPGKMTEVTADQVKKLLDHVLDFNRQSPTVLYSPTVPPKFKEAIKKHQVVVGMDRDAVLSAKGPPDRKVREVRDGVEQVDWIYGLPPHALFVTFDGDTVVSVKQY